MLQPLICNFKRNKFNDKMTDVLTGPHKTVFWLTEKN